MNKSVRLVNRQNHATGIEYVRLDSLESDYRTDLS